MRLRSPKYVTPAEAEYNQSAAERFDRERALYDEGYAAGALTRSQYRQRLRLLAKEYRLSCAEFRALLRDLETVGEMRRLSLLLGARGPIQ